MPIEDDAKAPLARGRRRGHQRVSRSVSGAGVGQQPEKQLTALKNIDVGEPDANAEFFLALRSKTDPMYKKGFYEWDGGVLDQFRNSAKFILTGQKGTGKTALLRNLQEKLSEDYETSFVIFKKEIIEEAQLGDVGAAAYLVDEDKLKSTKLYYHCMKRLMLVLLLAKCKEVDDRPGEATGWFSSKISEFRESSIGQLVTLAADSIISIIQSTNVDIDKVSDGKLKIDASQAVKKSNEAFSKYAFSQFKSKNLKARIFLDEMHFAYQDSNTLSSDAALVRDTLLAAREINEKMIENEIDCLIYVSIRSEFLEHQEIAMADISHTIESYGVEISWSSAPYNANHPIFDMIYKRLKISTHGKLSKDDIFTYYVPVKIGVFLDFTWGKPRDIVRYFKAAKQAYPNRASIRQGTEFNDVIRRYAHSSWQDMKSALASFVPKNSIPILEKALQEVASRNFDGSKEFKIDQMREILAVPHDNMKSYGVKYDVDELINLLFIIGILFVSYKDASGQRIFHRFHRGNKAVYKGGQFFVHKAIAKALS